MSKTPSTVPSVSWYFEYIRTPNGYCRKLVRFGGTFQCHLGRDTADYRNMDGNKVRLFSLHTHINIHTHTCKLLADRHTALITIVYTICDFFWWIYITCSIASYIFLLFILWSFYYYLIAIRWPSANQKCLWIVKCSRIDSCIDALGSVFNFR